MVQPSYFLTPHQQSSALDTFSTMAARNCATAAFCYYSTTATLGHLGQQDFSRGFNVSTGLSIYMPVHILTRTLRHAVLSSATLYTVTFHLPIRAQIMNLSDATFAGVILLPILGGAAVGAAIAGILSSQKNLTFATMMVSSLLQVVACVLFSRLPGTIEIAPRQWVYSAILGISTGMSVGTSTLISLLYADLNDLGWLFSRPELDCCLD